MAEAKKINEVSLEERKEEIALQGELAVDRYLEQVAAMKEERMDRVGRILGSGKKLDYHPALIQKFIMTVNGVAKKHGLLGAVGAMAQRNPKTGMGYTCPMDFGDAVLEMFKENHIPIEDIQRIQNSILEICTNLNK